jgi:alkanesulfonate monooxygenase SsuD/methylene tetrahydromethanopterin reductase-like flavin-dependent oxidoreductase (luciferase family)
MRFDSGLLSPIGDVSNYPPIHQWRALAKMLESCGYTGLWVAEHHFHYEAGAPATPPNPLMLGAYIASETQRLRLGQSGVVMPAWHPLRVAEDAAMLDHLSGGRLDFGMLKGLNGKASTNLDSVGKPRNHEETNAEVMWEAFEIVKKCWSGKAFRHDGKYFSLPYPWRTQGKPGKVDPVFYSEEGELTALKGSPVPLQQPLPPCWVMVDSVSSHTTAGELGVGAVSWANTFEGTREAWTAYRQAARLGADALPAGANSHVAMMRPTYVAKDSAAAEDVMRPAINGLYGHSFLTDGSLKQWVGRERILASYEELTERERTCDWYDFLKGRGWIFVGTPEEVTELLKRYESELGAEHLIAYWGLPGISFEQQVESTKLFADKVMPHFSDRSDTTLSATG